jgi:hypothetical protein
MTNGIELFGPTGLILGLRSLSYTAAESSGSKLFPTLTDTFCLRDQRERQQQFAPRPFNIAVG